MCVIFPSPPLTLASPVRLPATPPITSLRAAHNHFRDSAATHCEKSELTPPQLIHGDKRICWPCAVYDKCPFQRMGPDGSKYASFRRQVLGEGFDRKSFHSRGYVGVDWSCVLQGVQTTHLVLTLLPVHPSVPPAVPLPASFSPCVPVYPSILNNIPLRLCCSHLRSPFQPFRWAFGRIAPRTRPLQTGLPAAGPSLGPPPGAGLLDARRSWFARCAAA